ncbi:MAG: hypothetical protein P1R58_02855 [bacterium]|nr:hypothetical protein [bacterium]
MNNFSLSELPPPAKLMVGLVTSLMILVTLWVAFIYYVDKGMISEEEAVPLYLQQEAREILTEDPEAVHTPVWDSTQKGLEEQLDTAALARRLHEYWLKQEQEESEFEKWRGRLRQNVGLAHTHINGQTVLFFVMSLFFVFSVARPKAKKVALWTFALAIVFHAIGLSGESFHWFFDDIMALSGLLIVASMLYMAYWILVTLGRQSEGSTKKDQLTDA